MSDVIPLDPHFYACQRGLRQVMPAVTISAFGGTGNFTIPADALIEGFRLRLAGNVVISAVTTGGTARPHNPAELLKKIELTIGTRKIRLDGLAAYVKSVLRTGQPPSIDGITTTEAASTGTYGIYIDVPIDCASFGVAPAELGLLVATQGQAINLYVETGAYSDLVDGATATVTFTGTITCHRRIIFAAPGGYDPRGYGSAVQDYVGPTTAVAGDNRVKLTPYKRYRGLLILCKAGSTSLLSDGVLQNLQVQLESSTFPVDVTAAALADRLKALHKWPASVDRTGIYYLEFGKVMPDVPAMFDAGLNAVSMAEVTAILNCLAPSGAAFTVHQEYWE